MTAKRVASACKHQPTIAEALKTSPKMVDRAEKLAKAVNRHAPSDKPRDVEEILWIALDIGLDELEYRYVKERAL
jgi:hypothetical protein